MARATPFPLWFRPLCWEMARQQPGPLSSGGLSKHFLSLRWSEPEPVAMVFSRLTCVWEMDSAKCEPRRKETALQPVSRGPSPHVPTAVKTHEGSHRSRPQEERATLSSPGYTRGERKEEHTVVISGFFSTGKKACHNQVAVSAAAEQTLPCWVVGCSLVQAHVPLCHQALVVDRLFAYNLSRWRFDRH